MLDSQLFCLTGQERIADIVEKWGIKKACCVCIAVIIKPEDQ